MLCWVLNQNGILFHEPIILSFIQFDASQLLLPEAEPLDIKNIIALYMSAPL